MSELDCEGWALKNWCFWTVVLEKTLECPLDCKEMQPVHPKGDQSWIFIGRTDAKAEAPILWPPDVKNWLIGKDPDAGKAWGQEKKGPMGWDDWMASLTRWTWVWTSFVSWWWTGSLVCCSPWGPLVDWVTELNRLMVESKQIIALESWIAPGLGISFPYWELWEHICPLVLVGKGALSSRPI